MLFITMVIIIINGYFLMVYTVIIIDNWQVLFLSLILAVSWWCMDDMLKSQLLFGHMVVYPSIPEKA